MFLLLQGEFLIEGNSYVSKLGFRVLKLKTEFPKPSGTFVLLHPLNRWSAKAVQQVFDCISTAF